MPQATILGLKEMGHPLYFVSGYERALFGRGQVILRDAETGALTAGSDPRADGCAMTARCGWRTRGIIVCSVGNNARRQTTHLRIG